MWEIARRWWVAYTGEDDTPLDGDAPAWLISLGIHAVLFGGLAAFSLVLIPETRPVIIATILPDDPSPEFNVTIEIDEVGEQETQDQPSPKAEIVVVPPVAEPAAMPTSAELLAYLMDGEPKTTPPPDPSQLPVDDLLAPVFVKPASVEVSETASGVLDRLTVELIAALEQRPTLVCWLFDQSLSLAKQREEIAVRMERIAQEIDALPAARAHELLNLVYAYGQTVTRVTATPTRALSSVATRIRSIPVDLSGVEITFTAVERSARDAVEIRRRRQPEKMNLTVVVFTDEAGDDQSQADRVASFCSKTQTRVFVVGVPAPFGQRAVRFKFKEFDPHYADGEAWAEVDQGPESRHPEVVRILMGGPLDTAIDSGFGPFSLCKLCADTYGTYFAIHADRNRGRQISHRDSAPMAAHLRYFFDPKVMQAYQPIYASDHVIEGAITANAAKQALVGAALHTANRPLEGLSRQVMRFEAFDQARLIKTLSSAQRESAALEPKIEALLQILEAGRLDRLQIPTDEKRWQAGYDLALGRTLALKARTTGYNAILADAKSLKFTDSRNNTWILERVEPADDTPLDSRLRKVIREARELLERVVREHPGTPWALIAAEELRTPLGYSCREAYTAPPPPPSPPSTPGARSPRRPPKDDERRELAKPKPRILPAKI